MGLFHNLILGFTVAATLTNLWWCFVGVFIGTLIGVLPGIGPVATIAMLLPLTFSQPPIAAIIFLAGIYYGAQYGGSTTAILVNIPGEASSVVTCLDGYQMGKQGRAGPALAIAAYGSFFAGCVCTVLIALFGPPIAEVALKFGAPEYFSMMLMGLVVASVLASGSLKKSIAMVCLGLILGIVGTDVNSGMSRFTFGINSLSDGIGFVQVAMGVFGVTEIVNNLAKHDLGSRDLLTKKVTHLYTSWFETKQSIGSVLRATALGAGFGPLPGMGPTIAAFASYALEKKLSKDPSRFGKGAIEGVAGPESANNAAAQMHFIPLLTLGIPGSASMALMLGAMTIHGIAPGPQVMTTRPDLFWGLIASMWIGNAMLLVLNLPLIGLWVALLKVQYRILFPCIMVMMGIGVYSLENTSADVYTMALFGMIGHVWWKLKCEAAPLILALVLGPLMEENLRRALLISRGDPSVFVTRPISAGFMTVAAIFIIMMASGKIRKKREEVLVEED